MMPFGPENLEIKKSTAICKVRNTRLRYKKSVIPVLHLCQHVDVILSVVASSLYRGVNYALFISLLITKFLGQNGTRSARCHFRAPKSLQFQGPPLPSNDPRNGFAPIKIISSRAIYVCTQQVHYTVKKLFDIPILSRDVTYQTLPGRE